MLLFSKSLSHRKEDSKVFLWESVIGEIPSALGTHGMGSKSRYGEAMKVYLLEKKIDLN